MAKEKQENDLETNKITDESIAVAVENKEKNLASETTKTNEPAAALPLGGGHAERFMQL